MRDTSGLFSGLGSGSRRGFLGVIVAVYCCGFLLRFIVAVYCCGFRRGLSLRTWLTRSLHSELE